MEEPFLGGNSALFYLELPLAFGQAPSTSKKQMPIG